MLLTRASLVQRRRGTATRTRAHVLALQALLWACCAGALASAASCSDFTDEVESPYW